MFVKKFEAPSLEQALSMVKNELGPNALILSTQQRQSKWFQRPTVEVTAAFEQNKINRLVENDAQASEEELIDVFPHRKYAQSMANGARAAQSAVENKPPKREGARYIDMGPAKIPSKEPTSFETAFLKLRFSAETSRSFTARLLADYPASDLNNPQFLEKAKARLITPMIKTLRPDVFETSPSWAVVGVAGSGKTSLLVKLALHCKVAGKTVGLLTADKRKILGRKELAAYARLLEIPFHPEARVNDVKQEVTFVDSPAIELFGNEADEEIEKAVARRSVVLVLDASQRLNEALRIVDRVSSRMAVSAVAFTRLDQISGAGIIYDVLKSSKLPLLGASLSPSFKTSFKFFEPAELTAFILKNRSHQ